MQFRKLKSISHGVFLSELSNLAVSLTSTSDCDHIIRQYNHGLAAILDTHAPVVKRTFIVRPDNPWNSEAIHRARREVRRHERRWKSTQLAIDREIMVDALRSLRDLINQAKFDFLSSKIIDNPGKKSLFQLVDSLLLIKPGLRLPQHDCLLELAERFSHFFISKIKVIRDGLDTYPGHHSWVPEERLPVPAFSSFNSVTVNEITALILACPSKSSPLDPLPTFLLKEFVSVLAPPITHLINLSLSTGVFPTDMKMAYITPLLKKHDLDVDVLSNYRPISILSFVSKLLERVAAKQFVSHLESQLLFVPVQSAYRSHHSTETALLKVLNDLLTSVDRGDAAILALLDQSAAFDTVDHRILLDRLASRFGVSGSALSWFSSYISSRQQAVSVCGVLSSPLPLDFGVPQGSVLGPILYILYISPLHDIAKLSGISDHYFADDVKDHVTFTPSMSFTDQILVFSFLSAAICEQMNWLTTNKLKLNGCKTDALLVSSTYCKKKIVTIPLIVDNIPITPSPVVRYLGVLLDSHLTLDLQIRASCKKAYYHLRRISRIKKHLSTPAVVQLVRAFVLSQLDYGNSILIGLPANRLENCNGCKIRLLVSYPGKGSLIRLHPHSEFYTGFPSSSA